MVEQAEEGVCVSLRLVGGGGEISFRLMFSFIL
jgi:hypothetical protein